MLRYLLPHISWGNGSTAKNSHATLAPKINPLTIAVVGAGAVGLMTVKALVEKAQEDPILKNAPITILWLDRKDEQTFGEGTVFRPDEVSHNANTPAYQNSVDVLNAYDFVRWGEETRNDGVNLRAFPNRATQSEYMTSRASDLLRQNTGNITIFPLTADVEDIYANGKFTIIAGNGTVRKAADKVVLAVGHFPREDIFGHYLDGHPRYFRALDIETRARAKDSIPKGIKSENKRILVPGYGSSSVDIIRFLDQIGYAGKITIVTTHPLLEPWPYLVHCDEKAGYQLGFGIKDVMKLAGEYATKNTKQQRQIVEEFVKLLSQEVERSYRTGYSAQNALYAPELDAILNDKGLREVSQQFAEQAYKMVALYKGNQTPPEDARILQNYKADGRLEIIGGRVIPKSNKNEKTIVARWKTPDCEIASGEFDAVFGGPPFATDYRNHPLFAKLEARSALSFERMEEVAGLIQVNQAGETARKGLYVVGPASSLIWGLETFVRRVDVTTDNILQEIKRTASMSAHITNAGGHVTAAQP